MTIRPMRDAQRVVLDAAGLDAPEAAASSAVAAPIPLTVPSTTTRSNHQNAGRDAPADADEQQVVQVVEPPLVERRAVEEPGRPRRGQVADQLAARPEPDAEQLDAEEAPGGDDPDGGEADAGDHQRAVDAEQLVRGLVVARASSSASWNTGSSQPWSRPLLRAGSRSRGRAAIEGMASRISGIVIDRRRLVDPRLHVRIDAALAPEREAHQPEHVERGHAGDEQADRPDPRGTRS